MLPGKQNLLRFALQIPAVCMDVPYCCRTCPPCTADDFRLPDAWTPGFHLHFLRLFADTSLPAARITEAMNQPRSARNLRLEASLLAYLDFNSGVGNIAIDQSGNGNNATLNAEALFDWP